jgi:hypothetical protein
MVNVCDYARVQCLIFLFLFSYLNLKKCSELTETDLTRRRRQIE